MSSGTHIFFFMLLYCKKEPAVYIRKRGKRQKAKGRKKNKKQPEGWGKIAPPPNKKNYTQRALQSRTNKEGGKLRKDEL